VQLGCLVFFILAPLNILDSYRRALEGIRATERGEDPVEPRDPYLLRDVTTILIDFGLRPEECFRLRWEHVQDGAVHIPFGKTANARRTIPLTQRTAAILEMRRAAAEGEWVFPAPTRSGHVEKSSLKCDLYLSLTAAFIASPALNFGVLSSGMVILAMVRGLTPIWLSRWLTENCPKPENSTELPFFRLSYMKFLKEVTRETNRLPTSLAHHTWSAEGGQYFATIANDNATGTGVCEIHCNISANACRRRKNDAVDTL
jgi:hypothetical protein